jgi:hypothetical protein
MQKKNLENVTTLIKLNKKLKIIKIIINNQIN